MRFDGYIRVSQTRGRTGASFQSPEQQADRIRAWAQAFGHTVEAVHIELDESGARADRPLLMKAISRVEARQIDGVIVARLDRFGRSLFDGLSTIERIHKAGGTFVSVAEGFDLSTDTGRLVLRILLSMAEFELERFRGQWQEAKGRAVQRGIHPSATPPFGYLRGGDRRLTIDPDTGPLVTEMFRLRAGGMGFTELGRWLEAQGAVTQRGRKTWPMRATREIIRNEVYLGTAFAISTKDPSLSMRNPGAHDPLTDPETWELAQRRGTKRAARGLDPSPVAPLMRCSQCRYVMRSARKDTQAGERWVFTCKSPSCPKRMSITDDGQVTRAVVDALFEEWPAMVGSGREDAASLDGLREEARVARSTFEQWRDDPLVQRSLGMGTYVAGLAARQDAMNAALAALARSEDKADAMRLDPNLREVWDDLPAGDRRGLLQTMLRAVMVMPATGSRGPAVPRLRLVWHGEDIDLPVPGGRGPVLGPFIDEGDGHAG